MKATSCPYVKISEAQATKISTNSNYTFESVKSTNKKNILADAKKFSLVPTAEAQSSQIQNINNVAQNLSDQLTAPFLFLILSFFLFIILMSVVYIYHWKKFSMNDPFIQNFTPVYFVGLILLSIPLIANLFF